jgi:predicted nucleic acid-binding protein
VRRVIVDTGPLVAVFNRRDQHHAWAVEQSRTLAAPLVTCEAVLTEAYHLLGRVQRARMAFARWLQLGRVVLPLRFDEEAVAIGSLLEQYADLPMDFADACLVRLAESEGLPVFTTDVRDFSVYRIGDGDAIPLIAPV